MALPDITPSPTKSALGIATSTSPTPTGLLFEDSAYAERHRKLLDKLIAVGIEKMIDVPKVVVVGSQSAGKSSILEALSGITFPRASGTCTRCPCEVRLFHSDEEWECTISLRYEKDNKGNRLEKTRVVQLGEPITDRSEVLGRLVQAQRAILKRGKSGPTFHQARSKDDVIVIDEVPFSENVICIDVKSNDVMNLSVIDLPGIIANVGEGEDESHIDLIKNLAKKEMAKQDCIILLCISMNEEFQNQPAVTLAKEADPSGERTLGVLTKPDRIEEGTLDNWKPIINGIQQKLKHGYFIVKNPNPEVTRRGQMTNAEARADEERFFQQHPWASMSAASQRLGSKSLAQKLSDLLVKMTTAKMPSIIAKVKVLDGALKSELEQLPREIPESHLLLHFDSLMTEFTEGFTHELLKSQGEGSLAEDLYTISLDFWADMLNHRPRFLPLTNSEIQGLLGMTPEQDVKGLARIIGVRDYVFEEDKVALETRGVSKHGNFKQADEKSLVPFLSDVTKGAMIYGSSLLDQNVEGVDLLNMSDVHRIKTKASRDPLPNDTASHVKAKVIEVCIGNWHKVAIRAVRMMESRLLEECSSLIDLHFSRFTNGGLDDRVYRIMEGLIAERVKKVESFIANLVDTKSGYTLISSEDIKWRQEAMTAEILEARKAFCINQHDNDYFRLTDSVEDDISLVAEIRAYWQVAYKRYVDNVRTAFRTCLLQPIASNTLPVLRQKLNIFDQETSSDDEGDAPSEENEDDSSDVGKETVSKVKSWLREDQATMQRRSELKARQATLRQSLRVINAFWAEEGTGESGPRTSKRAKLHH